MLSKFFHFDSALTDCARIPSPVCKRHLFLRTLFIIFCMFSLAQMSSKHQISAKVQVSLLPLMLTCHLSVSISINAGAVSLRFGLLGNGQRPPLASSLQPVVLVHTRVWLLRSQLPKRTTQELDYSRLNVGLRKHPLKLWTQQTCGKPTWTHIDRINS